MTGEPEPHVATHAVGMPALLKDKIISTAIAIATLEPISANQPMPVTGGCQLAVTRAAITNTAVALVSDRRMRSLNRTFRGVDLATDVLSFPAVAASAPAAASPHSMISQ